MSAWTMATSAKTSRAALIFFVSHAEQVGSREDDFLVLREMQISQSASSGCIYNFGTSGSGVILIK